MSITAQRLNDYKLQMGMYTQQHQMLLASDVLDMIEQLQDDLKDDEDKVVEQLQDRSTLSRPVGWTKSYEIITLDDAIEIVKGGGADA